MKTEKEIKGRKRDKKNILEWTVFGFSLFLVISIVVYLFYKTFTHDPSKPELFVEYSPDPGENTPNLYHVLIKNTGGETAEEVKIELVLTRDDAVVEKVELHLPFVPQESRREGWLNLSQKPAEGDTIIARIVSFKKP